MLCLAAVYGVNHMGWNASTAINAAAAQGYHRLSWKDLWECLLETLCGGSGGGGAPNAPTNLDISNSSTNGSTILTWSQTSAPTNNLVFRSIDGAAYAQIGTAGGATTFTDTGTVGNGSLWRYKVVAQTGLNLSGDSNTVAVTSNYNHNNDNLTSINIPDLIICYGDFATSNETLLTILSVPALRKVLGNFATQSCSVLTTFNASGLLSTGAVFQVAGCALLTSISVGSLQTVGAAFDVSNSALTSLSLASLTTCTGDFSVASSPNLATVTANALTSITGNLTGTGCTLLTTVAMANVAYVEGSTIDLSLDSLQATTTQQIFSRAVAIVPSNMTIDVSGPNNAHLSALNAQGQADYATLIGLGNTVNINP